MNSKKLFSTQNIVLMAIFIAIIAVCSQIVIPMTVPFTLQTFAVMACAGLLGWKRGTISVIVYILLGAIGAPVFAQFSGGPSQVVGPTGGFIIGFIFTALIVGLAVDYIKVDKEIVKYVVYLIAMVVGDFVCFVMGTLWFVHNTGLGFGKALSLCVIPFIIPDLAKIVVALIITVRVKKYVPKVN